MNISRLMIVIIGLAVNLAHADESSFDKAKNNVIEFWQEAKDTTSDVADKTAKKASDLGGKASAFGGKVRENAKETGSIVWDSLQEAGAATADAARKGASKVRAVLAEDGKGACQEDSALCYKE
ncbi:hypothetical protein [Marinomonas aquiplantarum]|uniref:Uncharacterized protein n=1 Tax=Marinomonas aquiplantarum TaxID=491951 RepID=A0A366CYF8_9GAMM|nr:hypothetical protein [Marinomonas aquiplantarum]RBO82880.1 hypothetical protein DFP76_105355 [Marinomonas aquiplantarum]